MPAQQGVLLRGEVTVAKGAIRVMGSGAAGVLAALFALRFC